jgi:tetratricopeptide (TPR) repeat protein
MPKMCKYQSARYATLPKMRYGKAGVDLHLPNPEKLAGQGRYQEAAELFRQKAINTKNLFEKRRYFDSAARCYESACEYTSAIYYFLEAENLEAAIKTCMKSKNPKNLSQALTQQMKAKEIIQALVTCSLNFIREKNFIDAQKFCEEALSLNDESQLPEALMNILIGGREYDREKIVDGLKIAQTITNEDFYLMSEITFIGKNFLSEIPPDHAPSQVKKEERKTVELFCSHCGAPFPQQKLYSKVIKCEYCGHVTKL